MADNIGKEVNMATPRLIVTAIRYPDDNYFGKLIEKFEGLGWSHVYPIISWDNGTKECWNISGWFRRWYMTTPEKLNDSTAGVYIKVKTWEIALSYEEASKLSLAWINFIGRGYGVGRVLLLPLYRLTKWKWVADLAGLTCSGGLARGLDAAGMWHQDVAPGMSGLQELAKQLDSLQNKA